MLTISLLTPFTLLLDGQPLTLASRRTEALFVYLLRTGQPQAREVLANLFWDDLPQTQAGGNLRVLIANLRKAIGPNLTITRQSIAFDRRSAFTCDLTDLERGLTVAQRELAGDTGLGKAGAANLAQLLADYQGELLPGFYLRGGQGFDEWLATEREWLWTRAITAVSDLSSAYLHLGNYQAGIAQAQRLVKFDPLREEGHQRLMQLLAADGQINAALAHYQRCVQLLAAELGLPPSPATTELFGQIQRGTWSPPRPSNLIQPNPPTSQPPSSAHNLPREMTPFIGREPELARLRPYLLDPAYGLVTVVGEGGSGKTRLALAVARQLLTHDPLPFPDGIWFVPLAALQPRDGEMRTAIAAAIGKALGFTFQGQRPVAEQLLALLQKRRCLLLLDNFEQLFEPETSVPGETGSIDFVIELLEQIPALQLLITARIPLDLNSEFVMRLTGLPVPAANLPVDAAAYASLRLFAERAKRVAEHFDLTQQLSEVAAICRFVAGLPLGIELAAAWSHSLTPIEILLALQGQPDFLTTRRRDLPLRQRSMRAVFDYGWQLLAVTTRPLLAQIACFHGGFTLAAAQAILATSNQLDDPPTAQSALGRQLDQLVNHALLQCDEHGRYTIHPLLRAYAAEKLALLHEGAGPALAVRKRHSRYYLALAAHAESQGWHTRAELTPLATEHDNLRQAWQWAGQQHDVAGLTIGWLGLWHFYASSARFQEGEEAFRGALEELAAATIGPQPPITIARLQVAHAAFLNALGRYGEAVILAQGATTVAEANQDDALVARGFTAWGTGLYRQAQYPAALVQLERGLVAAKAAALPLVAANLHMRLANTQQARHDFVQARAHYAQALALYRQQGHRPGEGEALNGLGWCSQQQQQLAAACAYLEQAQQIHHAIDNPQGLSMTLINLAVVYELLGHFMQADECRQQVLQLLTQFDDPYQAALVNHGQGVLHSRLGDYATAEPYYRRALEIDRSMGDRAGVAWTQNNLGLLYNHQGDYAAALVLHQAALQTSIELGATTTQGLAWSRLGQDYYGLGELETAYDAYLNAITIQIRLDQQVWAIESKSGLAATQLALHMTDEALTLVEEILAFLAAQSLAGAREPMLVYWHCYQVLQARLDPRAGQVLQSANQQINAQAAKLTDPQWRHTFLENIKTHHVLRQAYAQMTESI